MLSFPGAHLLDVKAAGSYLYALSCTTSLLQTVCTESVFMIASTTCISTPASSSARDLYTQYGGHPTSTQCAANNMHDLQPRLLAYASVLHIEQAVSEAPPELSHLFQSAASNWSGL